MTRGDTRSTADRVAELVFGGPGRGVPVRVRAWDGSESGPVRGPVLVLHHRRALRRLLRPSELRLDEAYIAGDVDIEGDLAAGLSALLTAAGSTTRRSSRGPVRAAVAGPDDLPVEFYELLLDPSMAYSCAYFVDGPGGRLAAAQEAKLDLVCSKLELQPGDRLLDVGCGWGALICHAAEHYGSSAIGITPSRRQFEYVSKRVADAGLADRVQVRLVDHLEQFGADGGQFDAVSTIEMPRQRSDADSTVAGLLHRVLRPGGRALLQQVSPGPNAPGGVLSRTGTTPDLHCRPLDCSASMLDAAGLQVRDVQALGEHYEWTFLAWAAELDLSWNGAVDLIGEAGTRAWRLHLAGAALAFADGRMGVEQILAVRPSVSGAADPARP